jgi:hypothetical protein
VPTYWMNFTSKDIKITLSSTEEADYSKLGFTWEIVNFFKDEIKIQLYFENPLYISSSASVSICRKLILFRAKTKSM